MKKSLILFLLTSVIVSCSKRKQLIEDLKPSINLEIQKGFTCESVPTSILKTKYIDNLDVSPDISYYQYLDKYLEIETPVPNKDFVVIGAYYDYRFIYSTIIIHITDKTGEKARGKPMTHLLKGKIKFKDLKNIDPNLPSFNPIDNSQVIHVVIYNDDGTLSSFRPDEAGGGVIVGNP